ncbi:Sodium bicarbonate cotransporter 3 [Bulinus truncatus]|nr:Sodium bicarbonate cotransporter 3 [Bulinus truncatus]
MTLGVFKGGGYHLDLFVISTLIVICSFIGLPWFVAATVLSINHVNSLKKESQCSAPGESAKFLGVREQRVTGALIFLFIGFIPMPVLFGVFLYMGVTSLRGINVVDRDLDPSDRRPSTSLILLVSPSYIQNVGISSLPFRSFVWKAEETQFKEIRSKPLLGGVKEKTEEHGTAAVTGLSSTTSQKKTPVKFYVEDQNDHERKMPSCIITESVVDPPKTSMPRPLIEESVGGEASMLMQCEFCLI